MIDDYSEAGSWAKEIERLPKERRGEWRIHNECTVPVRITNETAGTEFVLLKPPKPAAWGGNDDVAIWAPDLREAVMRQVEYAQGVCDRLNQAEAERVVQLEASYNLLQRSFEQESGDLDTLLILLQLNPHHYRSDTGWLLLHKIHAAIAARDAERDALRARVAEMEAALRMMYDKYENGDGCYEDPDVCSGYLGSAVKLSDEEEQQVYALLEKQP